MVKPKEITAKSMPGLWRGLGFAGSTRLCLSSSFTSTGMWTHHPPLPPRILHILLQPLRRSPHSHRRPSHGLGPHQSSRLLPSIPCGRSTQMSPTFHSSPPSRITTRGGTTMVITTTDDVTTTAIILSRSRSKRNANQAAISALTASRCRS
jgi:hypothetical protein